MVRIAKLELEDHVVFQDVFTFWKNSDPAIPILQQAKAEYANLK